MPEERNSIQREHAPLRFHHGLGTALSLVLVFSLVIGYILPSYLPFSSAASYTFSQTDWSGGESATATSTHGSDRTGWTKYESASSSIATSTSLTITTSTTSGSASETSNTDF